jgi:hypothetical protein
MPAEPPEKRKPRFKVDWWLVAVLAVPVIYFLPELLGLNVFAGIDSSRLNEPFRFFDREAFLAGHLPLWNPYYFAGFPHLAESESGLFYPGNIFIHMPGDFFHWYSVEVVAHFMIAGAGFYLWMRNRGHEKLTSAFLAATYETTPFLIFHMTTLGLFTSIVWLPWYFLIFDSGMVSKHPVRSGLWMALLLGFMLMSGSIQAAFLGCFGLLIYAICTILVQPDRKSRGTMFMRALTVLVPAIISPLIAAVQLLPTFELTKFSERAATDMIEFYNMGTWLNVPRLISLVVFPALDNPADIQSYGSSLCYLGVIPFLFAISSLAFWKTKKQILIPLIVTGVITLLLAFGRNLPGYDTLVEFPPFSMFRYAGRMAHVSLTVFLALAAPGLDYCLCKLKAQETEDSPKWWLFWVIMVGIFILWSILGPLVRLFSGITRPVSRTYAKIKFTEVIVYSSFFISVIVQMFLTYPFSRLLVQKRANFDQSLQFFDDVKAEFPSGDEIPRVLLPGSQFLMDPNAMDHLGFTAPENVWDNMTGNASGLRNVTSLNGLTPLNQNDWKLVLRDTLQQHIDNIAAEATASGEPKTPDAMSLKIIYMLGTDVLLLEGNDWDVPGFELWREDIALPFHEGLCAYRFKDGNFPDAYFSSIIFYDFYSDYAGFYRWLSDEYMVIRENVGVEKDGADGTEMVAYGDANAQITDRDRGYNWMTFDVSVGEGGGFLVTGENYYPGWVATIDGEKTDIYKCNYLLMGINVPPGEHEIIFRYQPHSVLVGMIGSISGFAIWIILMLVVTWIHRKGKASLVAGE